MIHTLRLGNGGAGGGARGGTGGGSIVIAFTIVWCLLGMGIAGGGNIVICEIGVMITVLVWILLGTGRNQNGWDRGSTSCIVITAGSNI